MDIDLNGQDGLSAVKKHGPMRLADEFHVSACCALTFEVVFPAVQCLCSTTIPSLEFTFLRAARVYRKGLCLF